MPPPESFDVCVIGAGTGGLTAASLAAQFGARTALIERDRMGGECLNTGCVPSKALLAAARAAQAARDAGRLGVRAGAIEVDFERVRQHVHDTIAAIAPHDSAERFERLGVDVIRADARFVGEREIVAGERHLRARRVIIATGSAPVLPPIDGLDRVAHYTNETIFDNAELPAHLAVIGGGPLGIELAQAHRRLGAEVTVIESSQAMDKDDPQLARALLHRLAEEGIAIREGAKVEKVEPRETGMRLTIEEAGQHSFVYASHLLVAAGRAPRVTALGLDAAGIAHTDKGIEVDERLRTSARGVYAVGDVVAGAPRFTHIASYDAGIAIRGALFRWPAKRDYTSLPWVTYTDPELAHTGMSEADARRAYGDQVRSVSFALEDNDRARAEGRTLGQVKVLARPDGRVLGASILAEHAGELIHLWVLAIERRLKLTDLARLIAPYPTFGEASKGAAIEFVKPKLFNAWTRGLVRALSWLP